MSIIHGCIANVPDPTRLTEYKRHLHPLPSAQGRHLISNSITEAWTGALGELALPLWEAMSGDASRCRFRWLVPYIEGVEDVRGEGVCEPGTVCKGKIETRSCFP